MTPKISDFSMARIFGANQNHANTTRVVETYGYMSPEYAMGGAFSMKSDIYAYGVLILEIVSGMKISSPQLRSNFSSLISYAWRLWEEGKATELVDSSVVASCPLHEALRCIHIGLLCVQDHSSDRTLMSSVLSMIENESGLLPTPKQPAYFTTSNCEGEEARENIENSLNAISITTLEGR
uniref:Protein kinase domain-containing protein n=1 Tax=Triticum urartu TaxID=4572 RepID=A0A8R7PKG8_TRIUA